MFRHPQIYFKIQTRTNGQNTSIKSHNIIFPLSPGHMNIIVISRNIDIGTCKTINSDSAEQVYDPNKGIHPYQMATNKAH